MHRAKGLQLLSSQLGPYAMYLAPVDTKVDIYMYAYLLCE